MSPHNNPRGIRVKLALWILALAALAALPASALEWRWSYQGEGVTALGSFTTTEEMVKILLPILS